MTASRPYVTPFAVSKPRLTSRLSSRRQPALHPNREAITGAVCGVRVEAVKDSLMSTIRQLDKLVDELAKGRAMEKILRA